MPSSGVDIVKGMFYTDRDDLTRQLYDYWGKDTYYSTNQNFYEFVNNVFRQNDMPTVAESVVKNALNPENKSSKVVENILTNYDPAFGSGATYSAGNSADSLYKPPTDEDYKKAMEQTDALRALRDSENASKKEEEDNRGKGQYLTDEEVTLNEGFKFAIENVLAAELMQLEGTLGQNPETGGVGLGSYLNQYTTRLFGAPFQLIDSVDEKFDSVNKYVGNEYLRNFMLNSPVLYIRPGMPYYTGGTDDTNLGTALKNFYVDMSSGHSIGAAVGDFIQQIGANLVFGKGQRLQKRLFGFRETYYDYMQHVNYMCRSMAIFLGLVSDSNITKLPKFTITGTGNSENDKMNFEDAEWENYRWLSKSKSKSPLEYLGDMWGAVWNMNNIEISSSLLEMFYSETSIMDTNGNISNIDTFLNTISSDGTSINKNNDGSIDNTTQLAIDALNTNEAITQYLKNGFGISSNSNTVIGQLYDKVSSVMFMVDPVTFNESITNETKPSVIKSLVSDKTNEIGSEIAFITNSNADTGVLGNLFNFLGSAADTAVTALSNLVSIPAGGYFSTLLTGAFSGLKGQKMIYPDIYSSSTTSQSYNFTLTLTSPYGDVYNYYMNIVVPLIHLICLALPRMVTSNTTASPFLVQAYIPGMCTVHLGIIQDMTITKNPTGKHVSVNGFPLTVEVKFTIKDLYNALAISPANDPASFLFNESLNDYMANMAGLIPSVNTYNKQREFMLDQAWSYFTDGKIFNDIANRITTTVEDTINPWAGR